jgi:SpoIID/LytB domain protein
VTGKRARRRSLVGFVTAAAVLTPVASVALASNAAADSTYYVPVTKTWTVNGHGYGHGRGLSQYGAEGAALRGLHYRRILSFYYPGTSLRRTHGRVRVLITADTTSDLQVRPHRGLTVRDLRNGTSWRLPVRRSIDTWRLRPARNGRTAVQSHNSRGWHRWSPPRGRATLAGDAQFRARGPLKLLVPGGSDVVARRYRGALRLVRPYAGATTRDTVNVVRLDDYVKGVVPYEMPASWQRQALRAQAVAARSYALWQRRQNAGRYYQICDTTACQVYGGVRGEQSASNKAVRDTARQILTFRGVPARTEFSASSGGWTASGDSAYLPAKRDRFDGFAGNTVHDWTTRVGTTSLESSHPEIGRLIGVRVTRRDGHGSWNGRVQQMVLLGSSGRARLTGDDFRWQYGLRSTWFTIAATPIIQRWRDLGGPHAAIGRPVSGEFAVGKGSAQRFSSGRIYWSRRNGAKELRGPILTAYRRSGGPTSDLGWPATGMMTAPHHGHKARLVAGVIYSHARTGAHILYGRVLRRWSAAGSARSRFGYPTSSVFSVAGGVRARFRHGTITWDRSSHRYIITHR